VALENWLYERPVSGDDAVFLNRFGRRLSVTGIQDRLAKYCKKAGSSTGYASLWITCHQFRHTFGRHLTESGIPVTSIQMMLGHACLKSTEVYLHISDRQVQADYQKAMRGVLRTLANGEKSE
jgi:site-specific recombinase XerD